MAINLNGTTGITTTGLTSNGIDDNATSTAMTLDTSGNVLVGRTSSSGTAEGIRLLNDGFGGFHRDNAEVIQVDRKTSNGTLISLRKDGSTVGSIGIQSGGLTIDGESGHSGLRFGGSDIAPRDNGADVDAGIQLGNNIYRFTDLYLSGGVYLGGTGSANKLDDYEEGTYTPVVNAGSASGTRTYASQHGVYTKIGRRVFVWFDLTVSSWSGASGTMLVSLPFSSSSISEMGAFTPWDIHDNFTGGKTPTQWIPQQSSYMYMYTWTNDSASNHTAWNVNTIGRIAGSVSYTVD